MTSPGGGSVGSLFVTVEPDTRMFGPKLDRGLTTAGEKAADNAGSRIGRRLATALGAAVAAGSGLLAVGVAKGLSSAVSEASDLNETVSKTNVVFGKSSAEVIKWSRTTATSLGQSQKSALDAAATFAIYGKAAGMSGKANVEFSTGLTKLASDMASFSNTSPEEAIEAIGAAMRGESDPIEKYGVLLNETVLKNRALKMGLIDTTKNALTPQQRVLAVQAELFDVLGKKGSGTMGDFARTQAGLANQTRIAQAQITNFSAEIGQAFLPIVTRVVTKFNAEWLPALRELWRTHGPAVVEFLSTAAGRFERWASSLDKADLKRWGDEARAAFARAQPVISTFVANFQQGGKESLSDTMRVTGVAMGFLADHADLLAKSLPYLVAGLVAYKASQLGANVAAIAAPIATAANAIATRQLAKANLQLAASNGVRTGTTVAATGATVAATAATGGASVATRALGVATRFAMGPLGIIITVIGAVTAAVIYLYKHNETARRIIDGAWRGIQAAIRFVADWWTKTAWPSMKRAYDQGAAVVKFFARLYNAQWVGIRNFTSSVVHTVLGVYRTMHNYITVTLPNAFKSGIANIKRWWDNLKEAAASPVRFVINTVFNKVSGVFNNIADFLHLPKNLRAPTFNAGFAAGGRIQGGPSTVDNRYARGPGGEPVGLAGGEYIVNAKQTMKYLPLLEGINRGFALGGLFDFLKGPANWVKGKIGDLTGGIRERAGNSMMGNVLTGMVDVVRSGLVERAKGLMGSFFGTGGSGVFGKWPSSPAAQRGDSGVWRAIVALIRSTGPISGSFGNAYRPGDPLWHGSGRAVDWMGYGQDALALFLAARRPLELIHRTANRDYAYTRGRNMGSFNNALMEAHRNHIHVAFGAGGRYIPTFDNGGILAPGINVIRNNTGAPEPLVRNGLQSEIHFHFSGPVGSRQAVKDMVLGAWRDLKRDGAIA